MVRPWTEHRVNTWKEFSDLIDVVLSLGIHQSMVFRGQSDSSWGLLPSFSRILHSEKISRERYLEYEKILIDNFISQAHLYIDSSIITEPVIPLWLMVMQHHHAPTRILDWSRSPYIALYFAIIENFDKDGALWVMNHVQLQNILKKLYGEQEIQTNKYWGSFDNTEDLKTLLIYPQKMFSRIIAQQGLFTICNNPYYDHSVAITEMLDKANTDDSINKTFMKIVVPSEFKRHFLTHLKIANITSASLFPGIDGIGRSIREDAILIAHSQVAFEKYLKLNNQMMSKPQS